MILDTRHFNSVEDQRQLDGAHALLIARGHMSRPVLLSEKLSTDVQREVDPSLYPPDERGGGDGDEDSAYSRPMPRQEQRRRGPAMADQVPVWSHDKFASQSRSSSWRRSCSRGGGWRSSGSGGGGRRLCSCRRVSSCISAASWLPVE